MISISAVSGGSDYFSKDDYYTAEKACENNVWTYGAKHLRQNLGVDLDKLPAKGAFDYLVQQGVGTKARVGQDVTFSAPKSVSLLYGLGDKQTREAVLAAHREAVNQTLEFINNEMVYTRVKENGYEKLVKGTDITAICFDHQLSRARDPQLHTHAVILNECKRETDGAIRAIAWMHTLTGEDRIKLDAMYKSTLASELEKRGFAIEWTDKGPEIAGVTREQIEAFSQRRQQIEQAVKEHGLDMANGKDRQQACLYTRVSKGKVDIEELRQEWRERAKEVGIDIERLTQRTAGKEERKYTWRAEADIAKQVIDEMQGVVNKEDFLQKMTEVAAKLGRSISIAEAEKLFNQAVQRGMVVDLGKDETGKEVFATKEFLENERYCVQTMLENKGTREALVSEGQFNRDMKEFKEIFRQKHGFWLSPEQEKAFKMVFTSRDGMVGIQGFAGVGKSASFAAMKEYSDFLAEKYGEHMRVNFIGLAPTGKAAQVLQESSGIESNTIHSYLLKLENQSQQIQQAEQKQGIGDRVKEGLHTWLEKKRFEITHKTFGGKSTEKGMGILRNGFHFSFARGLSFGFSIKWFGGKEYHWEFNTKQGLIKSVARDATGGRRIIERRSKEGKEIIAFQQKAISMAPNRHWDRAYEKAAKIKYDKDGNLEKVTLYKGGGFQAVTFDFKRGVKYTTTRHLFFDSFRKPDLKAEKLTEKDIKDLKMAAWRAGMSLWQVRQLEEQARKAMQEQATKQKAAKSKAFSSFSLLRGRGGKTVVRSVSKELLKTKKSWDLSGLGQVSPYEAAKCRTVMIIDESSMLDAHVTKAAIEAAKRQGYRVVMSGDIRQFQAVGAGKVFETLQKEGMQTSAISDIRRQKNEWLKGVVKESVAGDVKKAYAELKTAGKVHGFVKEERKEMLKAAADKFLEKWQVSKNTLAVAGTNRDVAELNNLIREELIRRGEINPENGINVKVTIRDTEKTYTGKDRTVDGEVTKQEITVGEKITEEQNFAPGDRIIFLENNKDFGVKNGEMGFITAVDKEKSLLKVDCGGVEKTINPKEYDRFTHAYAVTTHKSQGMTVDNVVIAADGNSPVVSRNAFYVGVSRAKHDAEVFVTNEDKFEKAISAWQEKGSAVEFEKQQHGPGKEADHGWESKVERIEARQELREAELAEFGGEASKEMADYTAEKTEGIIEKVADAVESAVEKVEEVAFER